MRNPILYRDFDTLDGFIKEIQQYQINDVSANTSSSQLELIPNEFAIPRKPKARRGRKPSINVPNEKDRNNASTDDTE